MFSKLLIAGSAAAVVDAHVRGIYEMTSIRNAGATDPQPTGDGVLSTAGPCGGQQTFGRNGVTDIRVGDSVTLSMAYNGGHDANVNHFQLAWQCGATGSDAAFKETTGTPTPENPGLLTRTTALQTVTSCSPACPTGTQYVRAYGGTGGLQPNGATSDPVSLTFTVPEPMAGADGDLCTITMLDQRNWGSCVDVKILPAAGPTPKPPEPFDIAGKDFSTTFTLDSSSCRDTDSPNCVCMKGTFKVLHVEPATTAQGKLALSDVTHKAADGTTTTVSGKDATFTLTQKPNTAQMKGTVSTRVAADGDPIEEFDVSVYWDKTGMVAEGVNLGDTPKYCGFAVDQRVSANSGARSVAGAMMLFALALFTA